MTEFCVRGSGPIYFVDDDELYRMIISRVYKWSNLPNEFCCFASGKACVEALNAAYDDNGSMASLVILDVNMPGMDGIETVRRIRAREVFAEVPIITMLSSSNDDGDIAAALAAGASSYCEKPVDIKALKFIAVPEVVE